ncbi:MAG: hypothetical protein F9K36_04310 [Burkholderiaceae bacterium]|nr:MAG: hypothetical protein F9K36_04310 [Burkholderiaceae bacterium]
MRGIGAIALTFGALAIVVGCGPYEKAKLDREVDRLCAIDGGVRVYETVKLGKENFGADGEVFPQFRSLPSEGGRYGPLYYATLDRQTLVSGDPSLVRSAIRIIRRSDGKVLAEQINYVRGGGDLPGPWAASTHQCKQVLEPQRALISVFAKEE